MLRFANIALSNPKRADIPPIMVQAIVTRDDFKLAIAPQLADRLMLDLVGQQEVQEAGQKTPISRPLMGPVAVQCGKQKMLTSAISCATGVVIGQELANQLAIADAPVFGVSTPPPVAVEAAAPAPKAEMPAPAKIKHRSARVEIDPAKRSQYTKQILVIEDAVSRELCAELKALADNETNLLPATIGVNTRDKTIRDAYWVTKEAIRDRLDHIFAGILKDKIEPFFDVSVDYWQYPDLILYQEGGKYTPHIDGEVGNKAADGTYVWERAADRDISLILYLNDDFEGGNLSFPDLDFTVVPKAGMIVSFPSNRYFLHQAESVSAGTRLISVTWATCKGTPRSSKKQIRRSTYESIKAASLPPAPATKTPTATKKKEADFTIADEHTIKELAPEIMIEPNFLDAAFCKFLCNYAEKMEKKALGVVDDNASIGSKIVNKFTNARITDQVIMDKAMNARINAVLFEAFSKKVEPFYKNIIESWENPQMLYYKPGGEYKRHADADTWKKLPDGTMGWERTLNRDISILLYLNDGFEGGLLHFPKQKIKIQPKPGLLVAFPSGNEYEHAAEPTTSGERYAIVTWARKKGGKKVRAEKTEIMIPMSSYRKVKTEKKNV